MFIPYISGVTAMPAKSFVWQLLDLVSRWAILGIYIQIRWLTEEGREGGEARAEGIFL